MPRKVCLFMLLSIRKEKKESYKRAAFAYLVCEFLMRGIGFISAPIFSRIMNTESYGQFSNFVAWETLLTPILTMNLRATISKSKYDFEKNNDIYLSSILAASNIITLLFWLIFESNKGFFCSWFGMEAKIVRFIFVYLLFWPAFAFQQIQFRMYNKYKLYVAYTIVATVFRVGFSVLLVKIMEDQFLGRVYGHIIPAITVYLIIYINIWVRGKKIDIKCIIYGLKMSIPLLLSAVSTTLLTSSDQAMVKFWCGNADAAVYSVAYSIASIAGVIWTALNQAWQPWSMDCMHGGKFDELRRKSKIMQYLYVAIIGCFMFLTPEVIMIMGGRKYVASITLMPPIIMAMVCQFFYAFYFNVEYFYGKKIIISFGTAIAAFVNFTLNIIFIPKYGYIAAAYTTFIGYFTMLVYHYSIVRWVLRKGFAYNNKSFFCSILFLGIIQLIASNTYGNSFARYTILIIYSLIFVYIGIKLLKIEKWREESQNGKDIIN